MQQVIVNRKTALQTALSLYQVRKVLRTRKVAPSGKKSKTIDLSGMILRMCVRSFVTFRCVLTKPWAFFSKTQEEQQLSLIHI